MARTWVLDTDTKGTGARMVPLEDVLEKPEPKPRPTARPAKPSPDRRTDRGRRARGRSEKAKVQKTSTALPPGHVRKKATGEIGRVKAVDPKAGTVTVSWLREGRVSTVPISSVARK